jgi:CDP-paratose 2-epimerase
MRILITGGAGFVGCSLVQSLRAHLPGCTIVVLDNLRRRGAELNLPVLRAHGAQFVHGDIRMPGDLEDLDGHFDLFIEASAEPSVLAGLNESPAYLLHTNLVGTLHCLEFARRRADRLVFLSTSRVYSIAPLRALALEETATRFTLAAGQAVPGASARGIAESFPVHLPRSLYGASKLASELIIQEYAATYGLQVVVNRCGVIAGPGQFGKVDQGVFTLWVANHHFGLPLRYTGFGGTGKQVRDLLHPRDLFGLLALQLERWEAAQGQTFNVGGGADHAVSLAELTGLAREATGRAVPVASDPSTNPVDIPLYVSDTTRVREAFGWAPQVGCAALVGEIADWIRANESRLRPLFT